MGRSTSVKFNSRVRPDITVAKFHRYLISSGMKLDSVRTFFCLSLLCAFLAGQVFSQGLKIDRKEKLASYLQDGDGILKRWINVGDDLYKARFVVPSYYGNQAADPFGDEFEESIAQNPKKYLEEIGVTFGKESKASYNINSSILTVIQNRDQMELLEAYFSMGCRLDAKRISIRAEIYELPMRLAMELLESCDDQSDHTPERNAVRQLVKEGGSKLVALPSVISRSGQRSKITSAYEVPILEQTEKKPEKGKEISEQEPTIGTRPVGTIFEVDPVLEADNWTLDIAINIEHHTGPPEFFSVGKELEAPIFHSKEIITHITLLNGSYLLVGTWKPTGKPEYEKNDLMHVIFLTASVQNTRDYGVIQPVEDDKTKGKK